MSRRFRASLSVIAGNLIPVAGVWVFDWDVAKVLAYFLAEIFVLGLYACLQLRLRDGKWTAAPLAFPLIFSFLLIQLFAAGLPIIDSDDEAAQARAWIVFIGKTMWLPALAIAVQRSAYYLSRFSPGASRRDDAPRSAGRIETGGRIVVMFFAVFFTLYFYQGGESFSPVVFVNGLVIGKIAFEVGLEWLAAADEKTAGKPR